MGRRHLRSVGQNHGDPRLLVECGVLKAPCRAGDVRRQVEKRERLAARCQNRRAMWMTLGRARQQAPDRRGDKGHVR